MLLNHLHIVCLDYLKSSETTEWVSVPKRPTEHMATNKQHYHIPLTSSDTSQPMAPGQHSSVLCIGIQVVQLSQLYSVAPSDRFIPLAPPSGRATNEQNQGIPSIQVLPRKPRMNTFNMFDLDSMKSLLHCWFGVSVHQRDNRRGVSVGRANSSHQQPRSQHFNTELTSWNEDTHRQLQGHSPGDNRKRIVNMLAYMRHIKSQESWDMLLTSAQRQDSSRLSKSSLA